MNVMVLACPGLRTGVYDKVTSTKSQYVSTASLSSSETTPWRLDAAVEVQGLQLQRGDMPPPSPDVVSCSFLSFQDFEQFSDSGIADASSRTFFNLVAQRQRIFQLTKVYNHHLLILHFVKNAAVLNPSGGKTKALLILHRPVRQEPDVLRKVVEGFAILTPKPEK